MANISISDLTPIGFDLFVDSDSLMKELNDDEFAEVTGGIMSQFLTAFITYTPSLLA